MKVFQVQVQVHFIKRKREKAINNINKVFLKTYGFGQKKNTYAGICEKKEKKKRKKRKKKKFIYLGNNTVETTAILITYYLQFFYQKEHLQKAK